MDIALYIKQYGEQKQMDWVYIWDEADKIKVDVFIKNLLCTKTSHTNKVC